MECGIWDAPPRLSKEKIAMGRETLKSAEWCLAGSFVLIFASLIIVAKVKVYKASNTLSEMRKEKISSQIPISISGAVQKPGTFFIQKGDSLNKSVAKARPKKNANLRQWDLNQPIFEPLQLHIEELSEIKIKVRVEKGVVVSLQVPAETRICDLKSKIEFSDSSVFNSKRKLKDGEILDFPKIVAGNEKRSYDR